MNFSVRLPRTYRSHEVLEFHARDPERLAEQVQEGHIRKGVLLNGTASVLDLFIGKSVATCHVEGDGSLPPLPALERIARKMLGLTIDPGTFESRMREDSLLGPVIAKQAGLRIPQAATPFEAITWAIIGQQINLRFAISLRRTFILTAGRQHTGGLWCYPDPDSVARIDPDQLARQKFSRAKAETLVRLGRLVAEGKLPLDALESASVSEIVNALVAVKGIGPWTAQYALLRGFSSEDCSLHGDSAVRTAIHRTWLRSNPSAEKPTISATETLLLQYRPFRSLTAAHLWASLR